MKQWNFKMKNLCSDKHFKPWLLNSTDQRSQKLLRKKLFVLCSYSILSANIDIVKIFCVLHNKVALLTRDVLSGKQEVVTKEFLERFYLNRQIFMTLMKLRLIFLNILECILWSLHSSFLFMLMVTGNIRGDVKSFICVVKLKSHTTATQI